MSIPPDPKVARLATGGNLDRHTIDKARRHLRRERDNPWAPDGFPRRASGADGASSSGGSVRPIPSIQLDAWGHLEWGCPVCRHHEHAESEQLAHAAYADHWLSEHGAVTLTAVEAAVVAAGGLRPDLRARTVTKLVRALEARLSLADEVRHLLVVLDHLDRSDDTSTEPGCWACARVDHWSAPYRRSPLGDAAGVELCRWCYGFARDNGKLPSIEQARAHAHGNRVRVRAS